MNVYFTFANHNGKIVLSENLPIPQEGMGIFTTIKIRERTPLFLNEHLKRLTDGIKALKLKAQNLSSIEEDIQETIKKNNQPNAAIRVTITDGNILIHERSLPQEVPISAILIADTRSKQNKELKVINRQILSQAGANDALFTDNDGISESTLCNIFSINKQGQIITPPIEARGLNGISRQLFMKALAVREENISIDTSAPLVLTNCLRLGKVVSLNGRSIADGEHLLQKLQTVRDQMEKEYLRQH